MWDLPQEEVVIVQTATKPSTRGDSDLHQGISFWLDQGLAAIGVWHKPLQ